MRTAETEVRTEVHRAADRQRTNIGWLDSSHSFSFGPHFDAENTHHGVLLVNNDDRVEAGTGFRDTPSSGHGDRYLGAARLARPPGFGRQQRRPVSRPGTAHERWDGHSAFGEERLVAASAAIAMTSRSTSCRCGSCRTSEGSNRATSSWRSATSFFEAVSFRWLRGCRRHDEVAAIRIKNRFAALHAARLEAGGAVELPEAPWLHFFVARGAVDLEGAGALAAGDAVRFTGTGGQRVTASSPAEVLVWEMHATLAD